MSTEQGERIVGSYRLIKRIGAGGMGVVYHGQHRRIGRDAAIKILPLHLAEDPDFLKRFEREAASVASLQHPHILPVWEYGEHEGSPYLVMPYIRGGTLRERLLDKPLTHQEASRYLDQIAEALDYAHSQGIIHRDVKPANLLLTERGHLYLADFGIAKVLESSEGLTRTGIGIGTPEYIAPEQAHGRAEKRSDLYALGIILFQMLTGKVPFSGKSALETLMQHMNEPLPLEPLRQLPPATSQAISGVLVKATQKDPEARYQSGQELAEAFAAAIGQARSATLPPHDRPTAPALTPPPPVVTTPGATPPPGMTPPPWTPPSGMTAPPPLTPLPPTPQGMQQTYVPGGRTEPGITQSGTTPPPLSPTMPTPLPAPIPVSAQTGPQAPPATARRIPPLVFALGGLAVVLVIAMIGLVALRGADGTPATATVAALAPTALPSVAASARPSVAGNTGVTQAPASARPSAAPTVTPTRATGAAGGSAQPASAAPSPTPAIALNWQNRPFGPDDTDERTPDDYRLTYDQATGEARIAIINGSGYRYRIDQLAATDFVLEVDVRKYEGPVDSVYGVFFRSQQQKPGDVVPERYVFLFGEEGQHILFHEKPDGTVEEVPSLQPPSTRSPVIKGSEPNRVTVTCQGDQIAVAINGQTVATYVGSLVNRGTVGIIARRGGTPGNVAVGFSGLRMAVLR